MAIRRFSIAEPGVKSNRFWDQDTAQGAIVPIAFQRGNNASADIIFSNIPQTFQDLLLVASSKVLSISGSPKTGILFDRGVVYTHGLTIINADGSSVSSSRSTNQPALYIDNSITQDTNFNVVTTAHILDYRSTTKNKNFLYRTSTDKNGSGAVRFGSGSYNYQEAINTLQVSSGWGGTNWTYDSTFALYGVRAGA